MKPAAVSPVSQRRRESEKHEAELSLGILLLSVHYDYLWIDLLHGHNDGENTSFT